MATLLDQNLIIGLVVLGVIAYFAYPYLSQLSGGLMKREYFANQVADATKKSGAQKILPANAGTGAKAPTMLPSDDQSAMVRSAQALPVPKPAGGATEGFADYMSGPGVEAMGSVPMAAAQKPQGCYPRKTLNPVDLLPHDVNSAWAQVNPQGAGDIQGKNFLSAGALVGVNTIGQSLRNSNLQLRAEPPNPQVQVGPWMQSTIEPDLQRRPLE